MLQGHTAVPLVMDVVQHSLARRLIQCLQVPTADLHPDWRDPDMHVLDITLAAGTCT